MEFKDESITSCIRVVVKERKKKIGGDSKDGCERR